MTIGKRPPSINGGWVLFIHTVKKSKKRRKKAFVDDYSEAAKGKIVVVVGIVCVTTKIRGPVNRRRRVLG